VAIKTHSFIEEESNLLKSKIIDMHTQILMLKVEFQDSQKELHHALQDLEEKLSEFTKEADENCARMTETLEKRFESEIKELDQGSLSSLIG
jgi:predicted Holliday junction resolvase-like endonuclease